MHQYFSLWAILVYFVTILNVRVVPRNQRYLKMWRITLLSVNTCRSWRESEEHKKGQTMLRINARMNEKACFARLYAIKTNARVERDSRGFHAHAELSSKHVQVRRMRRWEEFFHNNVENAGVLNCDNWTRKACSTHPQIVFFWQMLNLKAKKSVPEHYNTNFDHEFADSVLGGGAK